MPRRFDFVSPGVQLTEIDQSTVPSTLEGDGPLIIGRAIRGPANKPVRVKSLDDFVAIFGEPVYGPTDIRPDTWRYGNTVSPQYGAIAAQAWLSSEESPITFIRLLGDEETGVADAGKAGWETTKSQTELNTTNGGAYGLFLVNSGSGGSALGPGCLAAVFYLKEGSIELSGTLVQQSGAVAIKRDGLVDTAAAKMFISAGDQEYRAVIKNTDGSVRDTKIFSFDQTANNYIRNVFNTDAYKINSNITPAGEVETLFLGETYDEMVNRTITTTGANNQFAMILGLGSKDSTPKLFQDHRKPTKPAKTGFFINRDPNSDNSSYNPAQMEKLFRLASLHDGESFQNKYYVTIEDLTLGTTVNPNSTFSVKVRKWSDKSVVETFSNLNLNPTTENYIVKRIGDMNMVWSDTDLKFNIEGEYPNQSDYIRVEMADALKNNGLPQDSKALPFGYFGPRKLKDFSIKSGSANASEFADVNTAQTESFALGSGSIPTTGLGSAGKFANLGTYTSVTLQYPKLRLTTVNSKGTLNSNYQKTDFFGVNQTLSSSVTLDQSYREIIRDLPAGLDIHGDTASDSVELSFVFSLDDIVRDSNGLFHHESGSRAAGTSRTATNGTLELLQTQKVKQYVAPFFGGFDGIDIRQLEPFNNVTGQGIGTSDATSYAFYTVNKALDMAADKDTVDMDILAIPGVNKSAITDRMIEIADDRQDCLALIDLESAYTPASETSSTESAGTTADVISSARARNFDSSYAAAYHPHVRVQDPGGNGTIVTVPPTVAAIGAIAKSQKLSFPWFAPAGFNRGGISQLGGADGPLVSSVAETLNKANRDDLYELDINPIARLQGEFVIFGQKTLQQLPSALDRINVRRLMIFVKKRIGEIADTILFDNNINATWNRFQTRANRVLGQIKSQGGIVDFKVQLDNTTTTPDLIDRNILYAKVFIKPARAIEFIAVDFIITRSGVEF